MNISRLQYKSSSDKQITLIFLHGLLSDKSGSKSLYLYEYCKKNDLNFLSFDNLGHGNSDGNFIEENISSWLSTAKKMINEYCTGDAILVGSSKGGWLSLLLSLKNIDKIKAQILLAPAPDFTEEIWKKLSDDDQNILKTKGFLYVSSETCSDHYPIAYQLILDAKKHLILNNKTLNIKIPTIIIHGMKDHDVDYRNSLKIIDLIESEYCYLKLLKNSGHRLSSNQDLEILKNSVEEIMKILDSNNIL